MLKYCSMSARRTAVDLPARVIQLCLSGFVGTG